jgi:hypothetical protein
MTDTKKSDRKRSPSNFQIHLDSPDFKLEPVNCSRAKLRVDVPSKGRRGIVDSGFRVEFIPTASGSLEIRVWLGPKFLLKTIKLFDDLIDWSVVDGRTVSKEDRSKDKRNRIEARKILIPKTRQRKINVIHVRENGTGENVEREGPMLAQEASDLQERGQDVSGSSDGEERKTRND